MDKSIIIKKLSMGAFVGCFIVMLVMTLGSLSYGPKNVVFTGVEVVNAFLGSIVVGWAFSLAGTVYDKDDMAFPLQVMIQMGTGMLVLFAVAVYLKWMPINLGMGPIITWVGIAIIFAVVSWLGFYIYYMLLARDLNKKIEESNVFNQ